MINYNEIGRRIKENRKYLLRVSQEKMAEDLNMYQADISNLEKAKSGSGITDLSKLELIADYLNIPLETLLFGREELKMIKYHGSTMQLKRSKKVMRKAHQDILYRLTGIDEGEGLPADPWECGPYMLYTLSETQMVFGEKEDGEYGPIPVFRKFHTFVFLENELIGVMVADGTSIMQHIYQPAFQMLRTALPFQILDVTDVLRTVNPFWALHLYTEDGPERETYSDKMYHRMTQLREAGEDRPVVYIESVFVREDCRKNGIFRMYFDFLKTVFEGGIFWLNMEPTSGREMETETNNLPSYTISELGQLNSNASIAEKVGFTVDPDTWHRQAETLAADGRIETKVILVRKCAFYIPQAIQDIIQDDGDLVALGRSKQKIFHSRKKAEETSGIDFTDGFVDGYDIVEMKESITSGPNIGKSIVCYAAKERDGDKYRFGVSYLSAAREGIDHPGQLEIYDYLDDAEESEYFDELANLHMMLLSRLEETTD